MTEEQRKASKRDSDRAYRAANRERIRERNREYRAANREKRRDWKRSYRKAYPERERATKRRYYEANSAKVVAAVIAWQKANPKKVRGYAPTRGRNRRLRKRGFYPLPPEKVRQRIALYGNRCWMCGELAEYLDHVKPLAKGGAEIACNLRPACNKCNVSKGTRWPYPTRVIPGVFRGDGQKER